MTKMMMMMSTYLIASLVCSVLVPAYSLPAISTNLANFVTVFSGCFNNFAQREVYPDLDLIELRLMPFVMKAIPDKVTLYMEELLNSGLSRKLIGIIREDSRGVIHVKTHNFTIPGKQETGIGIQDLNELSDLTMDDLSKVPDDCELQYQPMSPTLFVGTYPDCKHQVGESHPIYTEVFTCKGMNFEPGITSFEKRTPILYDLVHFGERYQLPGFPANYINPCDNK